MKMQTHEAKAFVSKSGLSWNFVPGVPVEIPKRCVVEAQQAGAYIVEGEADEGVVAELAVERAALDVRGPKIEEGIRTLMKRNRRGDFTAGGRPNLNALFRLTELELTPEELEPIWDKVRKEFE